LHIEECSYYYLPVLSFPAGVSACTQCPAGNECSDKTVDPVPCQAGYISAAGAIACTKCADGE